MKRFSYFTLLFLTPFLLLLTACGSNDDEQVSFKIIKTTIDTTPAALSGEIEVSISDFEFTVNGGEWCDVKKEGNLLKLDAGTNYDYQNRTIEIIIQSGQSTLRVPVTQQGILFELIDKNRNKFNIGFAGGVREVELLLNVDIEILIPEGDKSWISVVNNGGGNYTIVIEPSVVRRTSTVTFRYIDKEINMGISQYDYLPYTEILGEARLSYYTNDISKGGVPDTIDVEIVEKVRGESYTLKGTFSAGVPREIPMSYTEHAVINGVDYNGQFRIRSGIIDPNFRDDNISTNIADLRCYLVADQFLKSNGSQTSGDGKNATITNQNIFYPSEVVIEPTGVRFNFVHIVGCWADALLYTYKTKGFIIQAANQNGSAVGQAIYENVYHISIFKEVN